jgi:hypothetical protein
VDFEVVGWCCATSKVAAACPSVYRPLLARYGDDKTSPTPRRNSRPRRHGVHLSFCRVEVRDEILPIMVASC